MSRARVTICDLYNGREEAMSIERREDTETWQAEGRENEKVLCLARCGERSGPWEKSRDSNGRESEEGSALAVAGALPRLQPDCGLRASTPSGLLIDADGHCQDRAGKTKQISVMIALSHQKRGLASRLPAS